MSDPCNTSDLPKAPCKLEMNRNKDEVKKECESKSSISNYKRFFYASITLCLSICVIIFNVANGKVSKGENETFKKSIEKSNEDFKKSIEKSLNSQADIFNLKVDGITDDLKELNGTIKALQSDLKRTADANQKVIEQRNKITANVLDLLSNKK